MPVPTFTKLGPRPEFEDLVRKINTIVGELTNLMLNMDSLNVVELTADHISAGTIDANIVTIRSDLTAGAFVQINGNGMVINDGTQNTFTADILGQVTMTGATVRSKSGIYPYVVMDPDNDLFGAYGGPDQFLIMDSLDNTSDTPALIFRDGSSPIATLLYVDPDENEFNIGSTRNIRISGGISGYTQIDTEVRITDWSELYNRIASQTLQQALDLKAAKGGVTSTASSFNGSIPIGATWDTSLGPVTWTGIPSHAHNQT